MNFVQPFAPPGNVAEDVLLGRIGLEVSPGTQDATPSERIAPMQVNQVN